MNHSNSEIVAPDQTNASCASFNAAVSASPTTTASTTATATPEAAVAVEAANYSGAYTSVKPGELNGQLNRNHGNFSDRNNGSMKVNDSTTKSDKAIVQNDFIDKIDRLIFSQENDYFPLVIILSKLTDPIVKVLRDFRVPVTSNELKLTNRSLCDELVKQLAPLDLELKLDYSHFISHPGNLFVKNISSNKLNHNKMFKFFNNASQFHSLGELNIFNNSHNNSNDDECFAILKFNNYLDVDSLLSKKLPNPFNNNHNTPLYLNKYISKKQRKMNNDEVDKFNSFNTIIVENLTRFFPAKFQFTTENLTPFFQKLSIFGTIRSAYFPMTLTNHTPIEPASGSDFNMFDYGFLNFDVNETTSLGLLKCIYFLNDLSFDEFMEFTEQDLSTDILSADDDELTNSNEEEQEESDRIHISIAQHKHNHYLYHYRPTYINFINEEVCINYLDLNYHSLMINSFVKFFNYQETNIYVNNFPIVFNNDDKLWERFWSKFGSIKLAKIIKPQFYARDNQTVGKIGFVFFKNFKMALKAIILTNNKLINLNNSSHVIKTSLAIQKLNKDKKKRVSDASEYVPDYREMTMASNAAYVHHHKGSQAHLHGPHPPPPASMPSYSFPPTFGGYYYYDHRDTNSLDGSDDDEGSNSSVSNSSPTINFPALSPVGKPMNPQMMPYFPMPQPMYNVPFVPYYHPFPNNNVPSKFGA